MKKYGMTMTCKCGYFYNWKCGHKWKLEKISEIFIEKMGGDIRQERRMYFCTECGAIQQTNATTGVTVITP